MNQESDIFESSDKNAPSNTGPVTFNTKREKFMVEIRRQSRQNILNRKRFMKNRDPNFNNYKNDPYDYLRNDPEGEKVISLINDTLNQDVSPNEINNYVQMIRSSERLKRIVGIVKLRLVLSIQEDTPIQAVIDTNIASELIRIVKEKEEEYLRIEATWCLTNLATGTNLQVQSLIDKGIIPLYVLILAEDNINLIEQAIWGIGNIAGDCIEFRDELLENKCMYFFAHLYEKIKKSAKRSFIKQLVWAASNLSRLKPVPEIPLIAAGIGIFSENLKIAMKNSQNDEEEIQVIIDSIWALSQITNPFTVKAVRKYSILPYIFELLKSDQPVVVHPSLRIVGAFSNGDFDLCQDILDAGGLEKIGLQLNSSNKNIRKEATWIISNICAGTSDQIQAVFNCREVIEKIFMIATGDIIEVSFFSINSFLRFKEKLFGQFVTQPKICRFLNFSFFYNKVCLISS